jgi:hypothetical protein
VLRIKDWLNWLFCPWHPNPWHPNSIGGYEVIVKRLKVLHRNEPRASRDRLLVRLRIRAALQMLEIALATLEQATDDESSELLQAIRGAKWP